MLFSLTVMIISQYVHILKHQAVHLKHMQFLYVQKKDSSTTVNVLSILPTLVTFIVSTFLRKNESACVCMPACLIEPLFLTSSLQLEFNGYLIHGPGTLRHLYSGYVRMNEK